MNNLLNVALDYVSRGWYVFPCRERPSRPYEKEGQTYVLAEKTPYTAHGLNDASNDPDQIRIWWNKYPEAMIGVNAGKSGLFVVDIDKKHVNGLDTFQSWNINDSAGLHSMTPSGGMHIVFTGKGKSSTNAKTGIDTRGEGGYFIVPPSKIIDGEYVGEYKYIDDWGKTPGVIPDGLMTKIFPQDTTEYVRGEFTGGKKQLSRNTLNFFINGAPEGERNTTLFKVFADFNGCGYTREDARETVMPVCQRIGLTEMEVDTVLDHAYSKPRTSSIPDEVQQKILTGGKNIASQITNEEEAIIETVLLSCLLVDNNLIPAINDILGFDDFRVLKNRLIYRAINRIHASGKKADYITVSNEITSETDKVSMDDISRMINQYFVNTDNVMTYANIIREKSSIRKLESLMDNKEKYLQEKNISEVVYKLEKDIADIAVYGGINSTNILTAEQATNLVSEQIRKMNAGEIEQLKTGFTKYDNEIGGLYSNELVICAGRAGEGKSALALSILNNIALVQRKPCVMFTLEMSTHETVCRLVCQLTGLPFKDVYPGRLKGKEWDEYTSAMDKIAKSNLYIDDTFGITIPELRSKIRKLMEKDIKLVVIDQLEQIKGYDGLPAYQRYDNIAYDIKNLTQEFNVPILLNHQLNRNITDRKLKNPEPQLSDLNQAGEKPANQVWIISHKKDEQTGEIQFSKIKMLKNRNGARIEFAVRFVGERMLFANPATESEEYVFHSEGGLDVSAMVDGYDERECSLPF